MADARTPTIVELATSLSKITSVEMFSPQAKWVAFGAKPYTEDRSPSGLKVTTIPIQRGYFRFPRIGMLRRALLNGIGRRGDQDALLVAYPQYASVADQWRGPVIYYATDRYSYFHGVNRTRIEHLEAKLSERSDMVVAVSARIANYFIHDLGCPANRVHILPNAAHPSSVQREDDVAYREEVGLGIDRPIAGIIGNCGDNIDWTLLADLITQTPWMTWVFVGPVQANLATTRQSLCRQKVFSCKNVRLLGKQPYSKLGRYARSFDVAVLPYSSTEPTRSGSSTRFYEHLAACRPILATRGVEELGSKAELITLFDRAEDARLELQHLRAQGFRDGKEHARWLASKNETWDVRAQDLLSKLGFLN